MLNQTIHLKQGSPRVVGGVLYDNAPWWSYLYWSYIYLGVMFIVGLVISLCYITYRFIKKESLAKGQNLLFFYTFVPFVLLSTLSLKVHSYFVVLFPLFSIFIVLQVTALVKRLCGSLSFKSIKSRAKLLSIGAIVILLLLPGPLWMTWDDPHRGYDSGYDTAGELVVDYANEHTGEDIRIIAYDKLSVEFYLPDNVLSEVEIISLFSDNFSMDILGRSYIYYPDEELYDMVLGNEIDMFVDEPMGAANRETLIRIYAAGNYTNMNQINEELIVYYLSS